MIAWVAAAGCHRGAAHAQRCEPCEDSHRVGIVGSTAIVAIADGHGSARCTRARTGADFAATVVFDLLAEEPPPAAHELPARIVSSWRRAVDADLVAHPPLTTEQATTTAHHRLLYGTTAIGVCASDTTLRVVQIGDGDVVIGRRGISAAIRPHAPVASSGGETYSLGTSDPEAHFAVNDYDLEQLDIDVILVATDGLGSAYEDPDWHDATLDDLRLRLGRIASTEASSAVADWCAAPAEIAGDDTTIAVVARREIFADGIKEES